MYKCFMKFPQIVALEYSKCHNVCLVFFVCFCFYATLCIKISYGCDWPVNSEINFEIANCREKQVPIHMRIHCFFRPSSSSHYVANPEDFQWKHRVLVLAVVRHNLLLHSCH